MSGSNRKIDMLNGPLAGKIISFALPLAATGILQQLFNAADVAVVGQFVNADAMAAVGSNAPIVGLLANLFIGIALGTNVVMANYTGRGDYKSVSRVMHSALLFALLGGVILAVLGQFFAPPLLSLLGVPDSVFPLSLIYLRIYMIGLPSIFLYNFTSAIFRSQGDTRTPLIVLTVSGVVNVLLNLFFVLVVGMASEGVATATVISNTLSTLILLIMLMKRTDYIHLNIKKLRIEAAFLKPILRIGVPSGFQSMVFSMSNMCIQSAVNSLGPTVMAASSAAFNIEIFAYFILNSFGQAGSTFIGQNYGAGQLDRCKAVTKRVLILNQVFTMGLCALLLVFADSLLALFNGNPLIIEYGRIRLITLLATEALNVLIETYSAVMRGYGNSLAPAIIAFAGICGVRIAWVYTAFAMIPTFGVLLAAYPVSWAVTSVCIIICYLIFMKRLGEGKIQKI